MQGTIAVTEYEWYDSLRRRPEFEVNFWRPSDRRAFNAPEFSPFFFKLKAPHRAISGFGYYARWSSLPPWLAWECFGPGNGCESLGALDERIRRIRARIGYVPTGTANIGCILILQPTFFPPDAWISQPRDWPDRTETSKRYDLTAGEGMRVWEECLERAAHLPAQLGSSLSVVAGPSGPRYGSLGPVAPRLGQGSFRVAVTDAYGRACAVTGEHSLPALEAAHIRSYAMDGPHEVRNGLLLRADLHRLFDKGYLTVTPDYRLEVSRRLRADYSNGRSYYPLHGSRLQLPPLSADQPDTGFLAWHNEEMFLR